MIPIGSGKGEEGTAVIEWKKVIDYLSGGKPMETKDNKPEEMKEGVVAVVTSKEADVFRGFSDREEAIQEMMKNIESQYVELREDNRKYWDKLREKYGLPDGNLAYSPKKREIRKLEP